MDSFIEYIEFSFGLDFTMGLIAFAAAIVSFKLRKKHSTLEFFYIYPLLSSLNTFSDLINFLRKPQNTLPQAFYLITVTIFLATEFLSVSLMQRNVFPKNKKRKLFTILQTIYIVLLLAYFIRGWENKSIHPFYILQNLFITVSGIIFISHVFTEPNYYPTLKNPYIIISFASLILAICTSPIYIAQEYIFDPNGILHESILFTINYIFYSLLFILVILAFLCPKTEKS